MSATPKTLFIFSQVFLPDPASLGQHVADVALEMAHRGHRVRVFTANRGYEDPSIRYAPHEMMQGVEVNRLGLSSFGKKNLFTRVVGTSLFMMQAFFIALLSPRVDGIFFSTSPPMIGFVLSVAALLRRVPTAYWIMDLNPDQLIAMGKIGPDSLQANVLEMCHRFILHRAALVVTLDRFMAERLQHRAKLEGKMQVMPPWPHENHLEPVDQSSNPFRVRHGLIGKFVIMYSGNHSPSNPLTTLLNAAVALKDDPSLCFVFVGGGLGKKEVEAVIQEHKLTQVLSLPYQPIEDLRFSLSAADIHVVSLGSEMVGIIHPCKIYGAMAVTRPILYMGPKPSHISDLLDNHPFGWHVEHGDTAGMMDTIRKMRDTPQAQLIGMGELGNSVLRENLSQEALCGRFCNELEKSLRLTGCA